jgi:hypothetical protein
MNMRWKIYIILAFVCTTIQCFPQTSDNSYEKLWDIFVHPQNDARTKLWWFHGETETTNEGITADLEAFKRQGIGGVVYYDQVHGKGEQASEVFSYDWWNKLIFASTEAKRLGLSFEINASNGYVAGGPWITPELGMQMLVTSDTVINGNKRINISLPQIRTKYPSHDIAIIAIPDVNQKDLYFTAQTMQSREPSGQDLIIKNGMFSIPKHPKGQSCIFILESKEPFTARNFTYRMDGRGKARTVAMNIPTENSDDFCGAKYTKLPPVGELEVSTDGVHYSKICDIPPIYNAPGMRCNQYTIAFKETVGRFFRVKLHDWWAEDGSCSDLKIGDMHLSSCSMTDNWQAKAAFAPDFLDSIPQTKENVSSYLTPDKCIDLSQSVCHNVLNWKAPKGRWRIIRIAYAPSGSMIKHGRKGMEGLECDKMSKEAAICQWNHYFKVICDSLKTYGCRPSGMIMDSHEAGPQNWTKGFEQEFLKRRGYHINQLLPALCGYTMFTPEFTERFLYDFRRTIADMISDNYYATMDSLCRNIGITLTAQAVGNALNIDGDNLQAKSRVTKPQGEFWAYQHDSNYDIKEASSIAHVYGKNIASAEAFTDCKIDEPLYGLKKIADLAYCMGINEFAVCASAYQPWMNRIPGNTSGGRQYCLNRNNTYWNYSRNFWDYQAHCASLLRCGKPVADICVFLGDDPPMKILAHKLPEIPDGYNFDACTSDALGRMKIDQGKIILPDSCRYCVMALQKNCRMTLNDLRTIASMVKDGMTLFGPRPSGQNSLTPLSKKPVQDIFCLHREALENKEKFNILCDSLWPVSQKDGINTFGKGRIVWGKSLSHALHECGTVPDCGISRKGKYDDKLYFTHRKTESEDIFYVVNHSRNCCDDTLQLRSDLRYVSLWNPLTTTKTEVKALISDKTVKIPLHLDAYESTFIILSNLPVATTDIKNDGLQCTSHGHDGTSKRMIPINNDWNVTFDTRMGGPEREVKFSTLTDWTKNTDERIRYYSGTARYTKSIKIKEPGKYRHIYLKFDSISSLANIYVNGKYVQTLWCSPWQTDITDQIKDGVNTIRLDVVNSLTNRMILDSSLPQEQRVTFAYPEIVKAHDPLIPSGIEGKIGIVMEE